jgi:hypothetical protein
MRSQPDTEFAAFIGIDWADTKHDVCVQGANSVQRELAVVAHRPDAIDRWVRSLQQRFQGRNRGGPGDRQGAARLRAPEL